MPHHACGEFVPALCLFPSTSASHYRPRLMQSSTRLLHFCPLFFKSSLHATPAERGKDCILSNRGGECWPLSPETDSYGPLIFSLGLQYCAVLTSGLQDNFSLISDTDSVVVLKITVMSRPSVFILSLISDIETEF